MIDADRSLSALGTDVSILTHGSEQKVAAVCEGCGKMRVIRYNAYCALCLSCAIKGRTPPMAGKTHSEETRRKMSEGRKRCNLSDETRRKMSEASKGRKMPPQSEETRRKQSATRQGIPYDEWESYAKCQLYCPKFDEACRESNRAKYGNECFLCRKSQAENVTKTGKVRNLSVHHVDMQKSQGCDSSWKLVPLCMNCHGRAHTKQMAARIEYVLAHTSI